MSMMSPATSQPRPCARAFRSVVAMLSAAGDPRAQSLQLIVRAARSEVVRNRNHACCSEYHQGHLVCEGDHVGRLENYDQGLVRGGNRDACFVHDGDRVGRSENYHHQGLVHGGDHAYQGLVCDGNHVGRSEDYYDQGLVRSGDRAYQGLVRNGNRVGCSENYHDHGLVCGGNRAACSEGYQGHLVCNGDCIGRSENHHDQGLVCGDRAYQGLICDGDRVRCSEDYYD